MSEAGEHIEHLVNAYGSTVLRIAYAQTGSREDARDICQTVFLKLLAFEDAGRAQFADAEHEKAWVIRTALNACHDLARSGWRRRVVPLAEPGTNEAEEGAPACPEAATDEDGLAALEAAERDRQVLAAVNELPPAVRHAIYLHYYEGYSAAEIAELTGERPMAVAKRLSRGRARLRDLLEARLGEGDAR